MERRRVLIGSPVQQKPAILREFLLSLTELNVEAVTVDYLFIDDNVEEASGELLKQFEQERENVIIRRSCENTGTNTYVTNEHTHIWKEEQIWKVARLKDSLIDHAREEDYDYLFLIDSDLVLHSLTLEQLVQADKDIIANIFWTRWQPNTMEMPQVWLQDEYQLFTKDRAGSMNDLEKNERTAQFLQQLRIPGIYEVGGLGACTLISRKALMQGVNFQEIRNVSFWGEDRHFCIRAQALGLQLYVDTHYPAYHIYRESELSGIASYKKKSFERSRCLTISLCMIVKNEEGSLERCLSSIKDIADEIIIVDTGSTDRTKRIAEQFTNKIYDFEWIDDFAAARNYAFSKATMDYILWLDADDVIEEKDRKQFIALKYSLAPGVDSVSMPYHLAFDAQGHVVQSLRRNRLVRRERNFIWIGAVHEYLAVGGTIHHSSVAITHKKDKEYSDRNLGIYRKRWERGESFTARDLYYYSNELRDHRYYEEAILGYEEFLAKQEGWIEDNIAACMKLADCYGHLYEEEQRLKSLLRTFEYDLPRAECCCRLGDLYLEKEEYAKAIEWYKLATTLEKPVTMGMSDHRASTWLPHIQLCVCYDRLGQYEKAKYHNDIGLSYVPDHPGMIYNKQYLERILTA
ncbi:glycosyltransferase [Paenibacillus sp. RC67]|uniref:glycosyltransferase n=1 Tax=Paenibacillus sp. RC67 TaxID=3039392 RepID=UPI0024AD962D|nr:glycosyltransferase [Paenibacillus sp. RC67]